MTQPTHDFRRHHRAASEALIAAAQAQVVSDIEQNLDQAVELAQQALASAITRRQKVLAQGLRHTAEVMKLSVACTQEGVEL